MSGSNPISFSTTVNSVPVVAVTNSNTNLLNALRPFIGYSGGNAVENIYTENYNGLQTELKKQFSGNTVVDLNYTWSHSLTTYVADRNTGSFMPVQGHIRDNNYGPGLADRRHVFTGDFVWEVPWLRNQPGFIGHVIGGWEVSGIQTFQTGLATQASQAVLDPTGADCLGPSPCSLRVNQIGDPNSGPRSYTQFFNTAALAVPVAGQTTIPSERPGALRLPGYWRTDLGLFKNIKLSERFGFQFRAEAFNAFNHTNPICCSSTTLTSTAFGTVVTTRDPRSMELGLKFAF
jgi:hypothetical protein